MQAITPVFSRKIYNWLFNSLNIKMRYGKTRLLLKNIFLLIVVVLVTLAFLEAIARIFFPQNLNYTQFDSILMYRHIPGFEVKYSRQEFSNDIRFNSKGLRDYEYSYDKPKGVYRILLLGSSFSQALQVQLNQTYENILERKLNKNLKGKYEVINTAVGGWGTAQELFFLRTEGLKYKPDLILLDFSMRDITENAISPLVSFENGAITENIPVKASLAKKALLFCSRYSHLCSLAQTVLLTNFNRNPDAKKTAGKPGLFYKNPSPESNNKIEKTFLLIKSIKDVADSNKIPLVMVVIPHREQVDDSKFREYIKENGLGEKDLEYGKIQKLATEFAGKNKIDAFDMLPYFRQKNINNTFYFSIDGHWNAEGHDLAADLLYGYLTRNNKLPLKNGLP